jgi:hypothetical protein
MRSSKILFWGTMALAIGGMAQAWAATTSFNLSRGYVELNVPENWQTTKDLFGMPLQILGPFENGSRPVIAITPTGIAVEKLDANKIAKEQKDYSAGRQKWLSKYGGKAIEFYPYKEEKWGNGTVVHSIGYRYQLAGNEFSERSYFAICSGKLYHLKTLLRKAHETAYGDAVNGIVKSFRCTKSGATTASASGIGE